MIHPQPAAAPLDALVRESQQLPTDMSLLQRAPTTTSSSPPRKVDYALPPLQEQRRPSTAPTLGRYTRRSMRMNASSTRLRPATPLGNRTRGAIALGEEADAPSSSTDTVAATDVDVVSTTAVAAAASSAPQPRRERRRRMSSIDPVLMLPTRVRQMALQKEGTRSAESLAQRGGMFTRRSSLLREEDGTGSTGADGTPRRLFGDVDRTVAGRIRGRRRSMDPAALLRRSPARAAATAATEMSPTKLRVEEQIVALKTADLEASPTHRRGSGGAEADGGSSASSSTPSPCYTPSLRMEAARRTPQLGGQVSAVLRLKAHIFLDTVSIEQGQREATPFASREHSEEDDDDDDDDDDDCGERAGAGEGEVVRALTIHSP